MASWWLAVFFTPVVLLVALAGIFFLGFTCYLVWLHRLYHHIPSPPLPSYYLGHLPDILKFQKEKGLDSPVLTELVFRWRESSGSDKIFVTYFLWNAIIISFNPEDVKLMMMQPKHGKPASVFKHFQYICGQRFLKDGLFTILDYETWKPRRQIYDPAFKRSTLREMIPSFNSCVDQLLETLRPLADGETPVPMKDHISDLTMDVISKVAFSTDFSTLWDSKSLGLKYAKVDGSLHSIITLCGQGSQKQFQLPIPYKYLHPFDSRQYAEAAKAVRTIGRDCIQRRIAALERGDQVPNDILTHILRTARTLEVNDSMDIETLVDDFATFYIAGQETTGNLLAFAVVLLLQHPDALVRLHEEIDEVLGDKQSVNADDLDNLKYTEQVLLECLRLYPPAGGLIKETPRGGMKLSGYHVHQRTVVNFISMNMSRLPEYFDDPDEFVPERFAEGKPQPSSFVYFPFGVGHRSCIGKQFAMMEAKLALARLFQTYSFTLPADYKLVTIQSATQQPADHVQCKLTSRNSSIVE